LFKISWRDLIEATGLLALIASLVFVGLQVRQDQVIARAELGSQTFEAMSSYRTQLTNPEFANVFAKMLETPEHLTTSEKLQIDNFLRQVRSVFLRECYLKDRQIFAECHTVARTNIPIYFGNKYAKIWWRKYRSNLGDVTWGIPGSVDAEVAALDEGASLELLNAISKEL